MECEICNKNEANSLVRNENIWIPSKINCVVTEAMWVCDQCKPKADQILLDRANKKYS